MAQRRTRTCDVCGVRPAVTAVRRIVPGESPRTEHLCEVHAAQASVGGGVVLRSGVGVEAYSTISSIGSSTTPQEILAGFP
jgi:hypothetical protein